MAGSKFPGLTVNRPGVAPDGDARVTEQRAAPVNGETKFLIRLLGASLVLALFQFALGASPVIILLTLLSGVVTLGPCFAYGLRRTVGVLFLMVWYQFSFGELITKSLLLQPIDTHLFSPVLSHLIQLAGAAALSAGALMALWFVPLKANLIRPTLDPRTLRALSVGFLAIFVLSFAVRRAGPNGAAVGLFMANYIFTALVVEIAASLVLTKGRNSVSRWGLALTVMICTISLATNAKTGILAAGLCYLITPLALGHRPSWRLFAAAVPAFILLSVAVAPAIHLVRAERDKIGPVEVLEKTVATTVGILTSDSQVMGQIEQMNRQEHLLAYGAYTSRYLGHDTVWYDRFILVGFVDAVARRLSLEGPFLGPGFILDQTKDALPRQLSGPKAEYNSGARITQALGLTPRDMNLFTTVPLPVELFAAGGFGLIFLIGTPIMALCTAAINLATFDFRGNVWAAYILMIYGYFLAVQSYLGDVFFFARQAPAEIVIISAAMFATTLLRRTGGTPQNSPADR